MKREILVTYGHNYTRPPIGRHLTRNGRQYIEFRPEANITLDQINMINGRIMPTYATTKTDGDKVLEVEIIAFAVVPKMKGENQ